MNFVDRLIAYDSFLPAAPVFRLGPAAPVLEKINANDVVLVLPAMYAGSQDFKNSPIGRIEGGLYHFSVMNSVLTNHPLRPVLQGNISSLAMLVVLAGIAIVCALWLKMKTALMTMAFSTLAIVIFGLGGFVYAAHVSDWHIFSGFLFLNGVALLSIRAIKDERDSERIESALEGMVSTTVLNTIKNRPEILYRRPNEQHLTVMFVDIEGFSLRTREMLSVDVFSILHAQIDTITEVIHAHGGVVDRTLGDGLMCFFGFTFETATTGRETGFEHAAQALRCAIEIQRLVTDVTARSPQHDGSPGSVIPLRIGLSTGEAFLGNLGSGKRIDFTIIGHNVNLAKRFEDACETFRVLMSPTTYEHLQKYNLLERFTDVGLCPRFMSIKHQNELSIGWECDPFTEQSDVYQKAKQKIRKYNRSNAGSSRKQTKQPIHIRINENDEGIATEIQDEMLTVVTRSYYCRKVYLRGEILNTDENMHEKLKEAELTSINLQVVSGSPLPDGSFTHTMSIALLQRNKLDQLESILFD